MNERKAKEIRRLAIASYKPIWLKTKRLSYKRYLRLLKKEYNEGTYGKKNSKPNKNNTTIS